MKLKTLYMDINKSPIGDLFILSADKGLISLSFSKNEIETLRKKYFPEYSYGSGNKINKKVSAQLDQYFNKKRRTFNVPLFMFGTEFQKKIWIELLKIPYSKTISYKKLAGMAGLKKGYQAVGQANSKNHIPIIIPCHRVITSDNKLGGYSCGLEKKKKLLELEGIKL